MEQIEQDELNLNNSSTNATKQLVTLIPKFGVKNIMSINDVSPEGLSKTRKRFFVCFFAILNGFAKNLRVSLLWSILLFTPKFQQKNC